MRKCANIFPYMRRPLDIYSYMTLQLLHSEFPYICIRKIWFSFSSVGLLKNFSFHVSMGNVNTGTTHLCTAFSCWRGGKILYVKIIYKDVEQCRLFSNNFFNGTLCVVLSTVYRAKFPVGNPYLRANITLSGVKFTNCRNPYMYVIQFAYSTYIIVQ
jgi:hypothetical protein